MASSDVARFIELWHQHRYRAAFNSPDVTRPQPDGKEQSVSVSSLATLETDRKQADLLDDKVAFNTPIKTDTKQDEVLHLTINLDVLQTYQKHFAKRVSEIEAELVEAKQLMDELNTQIETTQQNLNVARIDGYSKPPSLQKFDRYMKRTEPEQDAEQAEQPPQIFDTMYDAGVWFNRFAKPTLAGKASTPRMGPRNLANTTDDEPAGLFLYTKMLEASFPHVSRTGLVTNVAIMTGVQKNFLENNVLDSPT